MSDGTSQNLKRVRPKKKRSKAGRPSTAFQAWKMWGLTGRGEDQRTRRPPTAYTHEDLVADIIAGRVAMPLRAGCPRSRPDQDCRPNVVPAYYRETWSFKFCTDGRRRTVRICYECRLSIEQAEHYRFNAEEGEYDAAAERVASIIAEGDEASRVMFLRELEYVRHRTGSPCAEYDIDRDADRQAIHRLAAKLRVELRAAA